MKTMSTRLLQFLIVSCVVWIFNGCTLSTGDIAGTGSQAGNGIVVAVVLNPDQSVARGVEVYIRSSDYLQDTAAINATDDPDALTDSTGHFELDSIEPGTYIIEVYDGASNALVFECTKDTVMADLDTIHLQPVASFSGTVERENIPDNVSVYIQLYGLKHAARVDISGAFSFDYMPPGLLTLRILTSDPSLGVVDSETVKVDPAEDHDAGTFFLPFEYWRDTLIVRGILDSNGKIDLPVDSVVTIRHGRVAVLNLTQRAITVLPGTIGDLRLTYLHLGENLIDFIPPEIGHLSSLIHLGLAGNQIPGLPGTIRNLKKLEHIDLSENDIGLLHPDFGRLSSLTYCNLSRNRLSRLPKPFGYLTTLKVLDLSYNEIDMLPFEITHLKGLEFLSVNVNKLTSVPKEIKEWLDTYSTDKAWLATQYQGNR